VAKSKAKVTHCGVNVLYQSRQSDLELIDTSHSQGRLRCHFKRTIPRTRGSSSKLLSGSPVHLMMAKGPLDDDGNYLDFVDSVHFIGSRNTL